MSKTITEKLKKVIKDRIPPAGTDEALLAIQSELVKLLREMEDFEEQEKEQLRQAFNRGVVHGMLTSNPNKMEEVMYGFEQYYKENYADDKA